MWIVKAGDVSYVCSRFYSIFALQDNLAEGGSSFLVQGSGPQLSGCGSIQVLSKDSVVHSHSSQIIAKV